MEWIPALVSAVGTIIAAFLAYNQHTKNKETDFKLEKERELHEARLREFEEKSQQNAYNMSIIFGELWELKFELGADRVYIIQPHPTGRPAYLTIGFEVVETGVRKLEKIIQRIRMQDFPKYASDLAEHDFIHYEKPEDVKDEKARAHFRFFGTEQQMVQRVFTNDVNPWRGNVVVAFLNKQDNLDVEKARLKMAMCAEKIKYILPDIKATEE